MNNTYQPYAPHATIFRIRDPERFLAKKAEIEAILARGVADIAHEDLAERVALFRVDSRLRPEMQLEIREFLDIPAADDTMRI